MRISDHSKACEQPQAVIVGRFHAFARVPAPNDTVQDSGITVIRGCSGSMKSYSHMMPQSFSETCSGFVAIPLEDAYIAGLMNTAHEVFPRQGLLKNRRLTND